MRFPTRLLLPVIAVAIVAPAVIAAAVAASPSAPVGAQPASGAATHAAVLVPPAKLEIVNREIVVFRAAPGGRTPKVRADIAKRHLIAAYQRNNNLKFTVNEIEGASQVVADGKVMFAILEGDIDRTSGESPEEVAAIAVERLAKIVEELRERGDVKSVLTGVGLATAATLIWILLLRGVMAVDRRMGRWAARRAGEQAQALKLSGVHLFEQANLVRAARVGVRAASWAIAFVLTFFWLNAALTAVPQSRAWGERLTALLFEVLGTIGNGMLAALPGLLFVVAIVLIARLVVHWGGLFFERLIREGASYGWLDRDTAPPTRMVFTLAVWLFALAMAYPYLPGSNSQAFQGLSVLVGLMVSIGGASTVGQGASGLILMYTRAFRKGEFVRIQDVEGTVTELGLFSTRIRTGMGDEVVLPNTMVLGTTTRNYSRAVAGTGFVVDTNVTIGYDTPWRQVHAMLVEAARRVPSISASPEPHVMQTALSDFYPEYRLIAYSRAEAPHPRAEVMNQLHAAIQDVFNEHGVQIMSPHYLGDPADAKVVPKERWYEKPARPPAVDR